MKKILLFAALATLFASCGGKQARQTQAESDSLAMVIAVKDSIIDDAFRSISEIAANIGQIAERERLIAKQTASGSELSKPMKDEILYNISAIGELLEQNRNQLARLQATSNQLKQANVQVESLQKLVQELQDQLAQKDVQIAGLMEQVRSLKIEVASLSEMLMRAEGEKILLQEDLGQTDTDLHTVHYIVGLEKELKRDGIVDKEGFIGKTRVLSKGADLSQFTKADNRTLERIPLGGKRVKMVTSHPEDSYMFIEGEKKKFIEEIVITDKEAFWRNSKVLVIAYH